MPDGLPVWRTRLPFADESTGVETHFTNGLDLEPRARPVFVFHKPGHVMDLIGGVPGDKASLDIFWFRDESLEDSANLPAPGVIAAEIVEDLEAALEQFRLIEADLNGDAAAGSP